MKRTDWIFLISVATFSLGLMILLRWLEPGLGRDGTLYVNLSRIWAENGFIAATEYYCPFWLPPLYIWLGSLLVQCGIPAESALIGMNIGLGCLLPLISAGIAYEVTQDRKIALCSALLLTVNPAVMELATQPQRDMMYLVLCGAGLYFVCAAIRRKRWYFWLCAGIIFGASALVRYETFEMIALAGIYFIYQWAKDEWKYMMLNASVLMVSFAATGCLLIYLIGVQEHFLNIYSFYFYRLFENIGKVMM